MNRQSVFIILTISAIAITGYVTYTKIISLELALGVMGTLIGLLTYFHSSKESKQDLLIIMAMLDVTQREIFRYLNKPRSYEQVVQTIGKIGDQRKTTVEIKSEISKALVSLESRGLIKVNSEGGMKKYKRSF